MDLKALAFGAHADDLELGCGGTLIRLCALGHGIGAVALTRGEMGTRGTPEIRAREFDRSAEIMGLAAHKMLDIPDAGIEVSRENRLKVIREIRAYRPGIVFAPYWTDRHPDHENASRLVRESAYLAGLRKLETGQEPFRPRRVIFYRSRFDFVPSFVVDISDFHSRKVEAIRAYESQFSGPDTDVAGKAETSISRPEFLERIEARDRLSGASIGVRYGEPFLVREAIRLDDPVEFFGPEYLWTFP